MSDMRQLSEEIKRILRSPYRVGFSKIFHLLNVADSHALQVWARGNPCQIDGLAAAVLDGNELAPFSLDIVQILSCVLPFRNAVLEQKPMLLDTLLRNATTSEDGFHKYATTCTALLSAPLNVPEPAILSAFIIKLLDKAVRSPSADSIRLIYNLFCGLALDFLDTLPIDLLVRLQDELIKILRVPETDDHSANLICLAILARLKPVESAVPMGDRSSASDCRSSPLEPSSGNSEPVLKPVDRYSSARQFFTAKRSAKTLDLVTLKVILACSRSCTLSVDEAIESLKFSEEIVGSISSGEKRSWLSKNGARANKLYEKILRQDIAVGVKYAAISFIVTLMEGEILPSELTPAIQGFLHASVSLSKVQKAVENLVIQFDEPSIGVMVRDLMELACSEVIPSLESLFKLDNALVLISGLDVRIQDSSVLRQAILYSLSTNRLSEPVHQFLDFKPTIVAIDTHEQLETCPLSYHQLKLHLHQRICSLFLKTAFYSSQDEVSIDAWIATALLDKQMSFLSLSSRCGFYKSRCLASVITRAPLLETAAAPLERIGSVGWRNALCENMSKAAESQHQSIVRMVGEICQDLELRCDNFERPLREEQFRANDLDEKLKTSEMKILELESQAQERISVLDGLEADKTRLVEQVQVAEQRLQSLSSTQELLQQELAKEQKVAADAAVAAQERMNRQELAHLAIVIGKDEMYEERSLTLSGLENRTRQLADELNQMRVQEEIGRDRIRLLETSIREKSEALEMATELAVSRQAEIDCLVDLKAKTLIEKQGFSSRLKESEEQCVLLKTELDTKITSFQMETADIRRAHGEYLSTKAKEVQKQKESYETTIHQFRDRLSGADRSAIEVAKQNALTVARLEREISVLRCDKEQRSKEFAEAQEISSRLMAVMGLKQPKAAPDNSQTSNALQNIGTQGGHLPCDPDSVVAVTQSFGSSTSSTNGPTPKRTKTYQRFKSPSSHRAKVVFNATDRKATRNGTVKERCPRISLSDVTRNAGISTPSQPSCQKRDRIQENDEVGKENRDLDYSDNPGDGSFDDSDMFTSTYRGGLNGRCDKTAPEDFEDTTREF